MKRWYKSRVLDITLASLLAGWGIFRIINAFYSTVKTQTMLGGITSQSGGIMIGVFFIFLASLLWFRSLRRSRHY